MTVKYQEYNQEGVLGEEVYEFELIAELVHEEQLMLVLKAPSGYVFKKVRVPDHINEIKLV